MNNKNKRMILGMTVVLILVLSVSVASASWSIKKHTIISNPVKTPIPTPTPLPEPEWVKEITTDTHINKNVKNIKDYFIDFHKKNYPCGIFKKCPAPIPIPTPLPTPVKIPFHVPTPPPAPAPAPAPIQNTFDVVVTGHPNSPITPPQPLTVKTTVAHNSKNTVSGTVTVTITGLNGVALYTTQSKKITMKHHDTVISDEDTLFTFDTTGWKVGDYNVMISFPVKPNEINSINNIFEYPVRVPYVAPPAKTIDLDLAKFNTVFQYSSVGSKIIGKGEYFWIDYTIINRGEAATGDFTITSEGKTLFKGVSALKKGESRSGRITLLSSSLPYHAEGYNYLIVGKITTAGDINPKNDIMNVYVFVK